MNTKTNPAASRLNKIPPYLFSELDILKEKYQQVTGNKIIDFGEGNPALPPDKRIINAFVQALKNRDNHRYPSYAGKLEARIAVADWYQKRFGVKLNPETEVAMLIGSKEGVAHLIWALVDTDDIVYIPSPSYPVYLNQTLLAGGIPKTLPLLEENSFLPDLAKIKPNNKLKLLCLNYPNNPTGAIAPYSFYQAVVAKAQQLGFCCFNDNVYSELYYNYLSHSILQVPGAKEYCVEFHSLSKTFSICGWRIGFIVGNEQIIKSLLKIKQNVDSGPFGAIQDVINFTLQNIDMFACNTRKEYKKRLAVLTNGLNKLGWDCRLPPATFYLWTKIPSKKYQAASLKFTCSILEKTGILVAPGIGFGNYGEGYIRFAAIPSLTDIKLALTRLSSL